MMSAEPRQLSERAASILLGSRQQFFDYVRRRVSNPELAEDILQDSLLKAIGSAPDLRNEERLVPWFYRILRNAVIDAYRHRAVERLFEVLPALRPEYAEVIRSVDLEGEAAHAVADRLGITAGNLKVRRHRARQALRQALMETCRVCADHRCLDCTCSAGSAPR